MKQLQHWIYGVLAGGMLLIAPACDKVDSVPPGITIDEPLERSTHLSDTKITVSGRLTDNRDLMQYSILVVPDTTVNFIDTPNVIDFFYFGKIWGTEEEEEYPFSQSITIPLDVASGDYNVRVWGVDLSGNSSEVKVTPIYIQNASDQNDPALIVTTLDESQVNNYTLGQNITVDGSATDDKRLGGLYVGLLRETTNTFVWEQVIALGGSTQSILHNIPAPTFPGKYKLTLSAADFVNNRDTKVYNIQVN